jgi:hypothetical protein
MPVSMNSTQARVKDGHTERVREILDSYESRDARIGLWKEAGSWILQIEDDHDPRWEPDWANHDDPEMGKIPRIVRRDHLPSRDQFPDEETWAKARRLVFVKEHEEGLRALLGELAGHLETPLVVVRLYGLFVGSSEAQAIALAVQPGGKEVVMAEVFLEGRSTPSEECE